LKHVKAYQELIALGSQSFEPRADRSNFVGRTGLWLHGVLEPLACGHSGSPARGLSFEYFDYFISCTYVVVFS